MVFQEFDTSYEKDRYGYIGKLSSEALIKILQQLNKKLDQQEFDSDDLIELFIECIRASVRIPT